MFFGKYFYSEGLNPQFQNSAIPPFRNSVATYRVVPLREQLVRTEVASLFSLQTRMVNRHSAVSPFRHSKFDVIFQYQKEDDEDEEEMDGHEESDN